MEAEGPGDEGNLGTLVLTLQVREIHPVKVQKGTSIHYITAQLVPDVRTSQNCLSVSSAYVQNRDFWHITLRLITNGNYIVIYLLDCCNIIQICPATILKNKILWQKVFCSFKLYYVKQRIKVKNLLKYINIYCHRYGERYHFERIEYNAREISLQDKKTRGNVIVKTFLLICFDF